MLINWIVTPTCCITLKTSYHLIIKPGSKPNPSPFTPCRPTVVSCVYAALISLSQNIVKQTAAKLLYILSHLKLSWKYNERLEHAAIVRVRKRTRKRKQTIIFQTIYGSSRSCTCMGYILLTIGCMGYIYLINLYAKNIPKLHKILQNLSDS